MHSWKSARVPALSTSVRSPAHPADLSKSGSDLKNKFEFGGEGVAANLQPHTTTSATGKSYRDMQSEMAKYVSNSNYREKAVPSATVSLAHSKPKKAADYGTSRMQSAHLADKYAALKRAQKKSTKASPSRESS